jgi:hypothetical protein
MIPEEAVDVDMPIDLVSSTPADPRRRCLILQPGSNLPPAVGLRAHIELSRIMDEVVNRVYGADNSVRVASDILPRVHAAIHKLSSWMTELPRSLQLLDETTPERECILLHMMYNQVSFSFFNATLAFVLTVGISCKYSALGHCYS